MRDAEIELRSRNGSLPVSTRSGNDGRFELVDVPVGRYELVATLGLDRVSQDVDITAGTAWSDVTFSADQRSGAPGSETVSAAQLKIPGKARDALQKAYKALSKNHQADVNRYIDEALTRYPAYAEALVLRGTIELQNSQWEQAQADFQHAIACDPNYGPAYIFLGSAETALHRFDDATREIDHGIAIAPSMWQGYFEMGKTLLAKRDYAAALRQLGRAASLLRGKYSRIHLVMAYAYMGLKNGLGARTELQTYLKEEPAAPDYAQVKELLDSLNGPVSQ